MFFSIYPIYLRSYVSNSFILETMIKINDLVISSSCHPLRSSIDQLSICKLFSLRNAHFGARELAQSLKIFQFVCPYVKFWYHTRFAVKSQVRADVNEYFSERVVAILGLSSNLPEMGRANNEEEDIEVTFNRLLVEFPFWDYCLGKPSIKKKGNFVNKIHKTLTPPGGPTFMNS